MIENEEMENNSEEKQTPKPTKEKTQKQRKILINTFTDNNFEQTEQFCNNKIRTSKYTLLTFLPLALFYQFNSAFNLFFFSNCNNNSNTINKYNNTNKCSGSFYSSFNNKFN